MKKRKGMLATLVSLAPLGFFIYLLVQANSQNSLCGSAQGEIVGPPSISAQTILWEFAKRGSPPELQTLEVANRIIADSNQYQIDDAFAVANWAEESQDGRLAVPGTRNIGNITASQGVSAAGHIFAVYATWEDGIDAWYSLIKRLYVGNGFTDLVTFSLLYVHGIWTHNPTQAQIDLVTKDPADPKLPGYVPNIESIMQELHQHEISLGSSQTTTDSSAPTGPSRINQIPGGSWATADARRDAEKLGLFNCTQTNTLVGAAMNLALHLRFSTGNGLFNLWDASTPQPPAQTLNGVVQCVSFVASVYRMATGKSVPEAPDAGTWWLDYQGNRYQGFTTIPVADAPPQPGDFVVYWDNNQPPNGNGNFGHIAVIVGVQLPQPGADGFVIVAQGNSTNVLAEESLSQTPSGWVLGKYDLGQTAKGYIRVVSH